VEGRRDRLEADFLRLAGERQRPGNGLMARTSLALLRMTRAADGTGRSVLIQELSDCLDSSRGVLSYPARQVLRRLQGISGLLRDDPGYDGLFARMRERIRALDGDAAEGELLYQRGYEHLDASEPGKALEYLGQAKLKLTQDDTLHAACRAALGCAMAYNELGLFWAMRMEALSVGHIALGLERGELRFPQEGFWAVTFLARHDLMVGRPLGTLAWFESAAYTASYLQSREELTDAMTRELDSLDVLLAVRLFREPPSVVTAWNWLMPVCRQLGMSFSHAALRFLSGDAPALLREVPPTFAASEADLEARFREVSDAVPATDFMPAVQPPGIGFVILVTTRFGVEYRITAANSPGPVLLAENLLGIIEAALAVARWENLAFVQDRFDLRIDTSRTGENPPKIDFVRRPEDGEFRLDCRADLFDWLCRGPHTEVWEWLQYFLFSILITLTIDPIDDLQAEFEEWHKAGTFSRALAYSPTAILLDNLIGGKWYDRARWAHPAAAPAV
jgi:hypothetical protein